VELDGELHGAVDNDVVEPGGRDQLMVAGVDRPDIVRRVLEDKAQRPGGDHEAPPDSLGNGVGSTQPLRCRGLIEGRCGPLQYEPGRQLIFTHQADGSAIARRVSAEAVGCCAETADQVDWPANCAPCKRA
jgi:hypothetical protein